MKYRAMFTTLAVLALSTLSAYGDAKDDLAAAINKTADSPNYSWSTTVEGGFGAGTTTGKTEKDGYTQVALSMRNTSYDVVIKGKSAAIKTDSGWKSAEELTAAPADPNAGPDPARFVAMQVATYKAPLAMAQDAVPAKVADIKAETDGFSGSLTDAAAKELLTFRRRPNAAADAPAPEIKNGKATFRVWTKDGLVTKIQNHVTGTVTFNGNDRDVDRTTTTDITDLGTTKIEVPDEAKAKLAAAAAPVPHVTQVQIQTPK